jgi:hypothetical protein
MKDFMDKVQKEILPLLRKYKNYLTVAGLFVVMLVILFFFAVKQ